jgi:hypothetical protein
VQHTLQAFAVFLSAPHVGESALFDRTKQTVHPDFFQQAQGIVKYLAGPPRDLAVGLKEDFILRPLGRAKHIVSAFKTKITVLDKGIVNGLRVHP